MGTVKILAHRKLSMLEQSEVEIIWTVSSELGTFRQKTRSLAPLNGWTCAVEICHDGMLEDTNSLDGAHIMVALSTYHKGERLLQKNVSLCKNITDFRSSLRRDWRTEVIGKYPLKLFIVHKWAATWQNQQNDLCAQRRLRSGWADAQADQNLCCPHEESLGP